MASPAAAAEVIREALAPAIRVAPDGTATVHLGQTLFGIELRRVDVFGSDRTGLVSVVGSKNL